MKQQGDHYTAEQEEHFDSSHAEEGSIFSVMRNMMNFASLLRVGGAMIMLVAMSSYLMQGWSEGNDISRYYMLLSQTLALAAGGFGLSYLLKENKGARIFFGLGLISITVNMTTLGALIFSTMQWGSELVQYPSYAKWVAPEFGEIILALLGTIAVSAPVAWIGHKVLARRSAGTLSALFLLTNLLLLIPVRESLFVGIAALIAVILPIVIFSKRMSQDNALRTPEGLIGMATVLVPAGIIICRSIWLYPMDELLQMILSGTAFVALRFCAYQTEAESKARKLTHLLSLGAAFSIAMPAALLAQRYLPEGMDFSVFGIILAGLLLDISTRCHKPLATVHMAALVLITSNILPVFMTGNISNSVMCILAGLTTILLGYQYGLRTLIPLGLVTVLCGIGSPAFEFIQWLDFSNWITLSVTGGVIIIAASLIERHGALIKMKWDSLKSPAEK